MNRLFLLYLLCLLSIYSSLAQGQELTLDGLKEHFNTAYDSTLQYRNYLRNKVEEVNVNELEVTGGKRLPILCSTDDYFYYLIHYLPLPLRTYVLDRYDSEYPSHHRYSTPEERNEQFYLTIKALPPNIKDKAVDAKDGLQSYLSNTPSIGLYDAIEEYSANWDTYIDLDIKDRLMLTKKEMDEKLISHRKALKEYIDQGMTVKELFGNPESAEQDRAYSHEQWMGDTKRLNQLLINQQKAVKEWHHSVELGFLDAVTTLGPLRRLAEEMFDDTMNKTMESIGGLERKQTAGLDKWNQASLSSLEELNGHMVDLPFTTTLEDLDEVKRNVDDLFIQCVKLLDDIKIHKDSKKLALSISKIWSNARQELFYSRWQWKYWINLWNERGLNAVVDFFTLNQ